MKRVLISLLAVSIFAVYAPALAEAKKAKAESSVVENLYGFSGTPSKDGCLNCGKWEEAMMKVAKKDWNTWKLDPGASASKRKEAYKRAQKTTREVCSAQEDQLVAYKAASAAEDYVAAAILTPFRWVEVAMYASAAKVVLNEVDTSNPDAELLGMALVLFAKAQAAKDGLGELCATASNSVERLKKKLEGYQGRIDRGRLFISRCKGDVPWPKKGEE